MSLNRTVSDLKVKRITIQRKYGNSWRSPSDRKIHPGVKFRLNVDFGNTGGMINWDDEQYRKDNVQIRIVCRGFLMNSGEYKLKNNIKFYKDETFTELVPTPNKYRTAINIDTYETHHADCRFYCYLMFDQGTPSYWASKLKWKCGIYASVRNRKWRTTTTRT